MAPTTPRKQSASPRRPTPSEWHENVPPGVIKFYRYGLWLLPRSYHTSSEKWHPPFAWRKYKDTRPTKAEICEWASKYDPLLWSVITGHGVIVPEFDGEEGLTTLKRLGLQPHIISPSGGAHVYFEAPPGELVRGAPRIDTHRFPGMDLLAYGQTATFYGNDVDGKMVSLASMNLALRGLPDVRIQRRNVLTTSLDRQAKAGKNLPLDGHDVVLANPPFPAASIATASSTT